MRASPFFILALIALSGCRTEQENFPEKELAHLAHYHQGDTLWFEGPGSDLDTFLIQDFGTTPCARDHSSNDTCILIRHLPNDVFHDTLVNDLYNIKCVAYQPLIQMHITHKGTEHQDVYYTFWFRDFKVSACDFAMGILQTDTLTFGRFRFTDYYKIGHSPIKTEKTGKEIQFLYWTDRYGLTAYSNYDGETWYLKTGLH